MANNKHTDPLEQLFKNGLENAKVTAPKSVWKGVSAGINTGASTGTIGSFVTVHILKIVAAVLVGSIISIMIISNKEKLTEPLPIINENIEITLSDNIKNINDKTQHTSKKTSTTSQATQLIIKAKKAINTGSSINPKTKNTKEPLANDEKGVQNDGKNKNKGDNNNNNNNPKSGATNKGNAEEVNYKVSSLQKTYCPGQVIAFKSNKKMSWIVNGVSKGQSLGLKYVAKGTKSIKVRAYSLTGYSKIFTIECIKPNADNYTAIETNERVFNCQFKGNKSLNCTWYFGNYQIKKGKNTIFRLNNSACAANLRLIVSQQNCRDTGEKILNPKNINVLPWEVLTIGDDNFNDIFEINSKCVDIQYFKVMDMQGKMMYQSQDKNPKWDGKCNGVDCKKGQYLVIVNYIYNGQEKSQNGKITLK